MSDEQATPRPWAIDARTDTSIRSAERGVCTTGGPYSTLEDDSHAINAANARLIVRAVNSHDKLVEALRGLVTKAAQRGVFVNSVEMVAARAALAEAEP